jgi:ABC-type Mn2+/Zn2+ transport system permease subunit
MSQVEYILGFVSILVGIAVADIAASLHRLLRARRRVRWHWYPFAAAFMLILLILELWWSLALIEKSNIKMTIGVFLPLVLGLGLLYLLASAVLPDEVPAEGIDLKADYFEHQRYFWILFAMLLASFVLQRLGAAWVRRGPEAVLPLLREVTPNFVLLGIVLSLAFVRRSWWHALWLAVLPVVYLASVINRPLG